MTEDEQRQLRTSWISSVRVASANRRWNRRQVEDKCSVPSCDRDRFARGWCKAHAQRYYKKGHVSEDVPLRPVSKWNQARYLTGNGYVKIWVPEGVPERDEKGHVLEHRYVMSQILGRPLLPSPLNTVHHKNGNRADNRPENLELRVGHHGIGATEAHCDTCRCFE